MAGQYKGVILKPKRGFQMKIIILGSIVALSILFFSISMGFNAAETMQQQRPSIAEQINFGNNF